jgi:hypothetical protein
MKAKSRTRVAVYSRLKKPSKRHLMCCMTGDLCCGEVTCVVVDGRVNTKLVIRKRKGFRYELNLKHDGHWTLECLKDTL